jgi:hypothetical protein
MNTLKVGFGRVNVTPMMGIPLDGYFVPRYADGVLDDLEVNALALEAGGNRAVLLTLDHCGTNAAVLEPYRRHAAEVTGVPFESIFISCTHSHNAPILEANSDDPLIREYDRFLWHKMADAAKAAVEDLQPARMGWAVGQAPNIAFVRRFRMKDGKIRTNPGVGNPDILAPIGDVDERLNVVRFDREDGLSYVLVNFGNHPDTVGGCKISGDWPSLMRGQVEKAIDNTRCIFFNGAQGDVNHVNVNAKDGDLNDLANDFDDVARGYGHTRHMARVMTGAVLQVFDKVNYRDVDSIRAAQKVVDIPSNMPKPEDMPLARKYNDLHLAGRDEEIPFQAMELTTVVAEAGRMVQLEHGPESFPLLLSALAIGDIALLGIPGEPFTGIGRGLKLAEGWELVLPCCQTNDRVGYFPMQEAYDEGGYEARSSIFAAGVAERIIEEGTALLQSLR